MKTWILHTITVVEDVIRDDRDLGLFWLSAWESESGTNLLHAIQQVQKEVQDDIEAIEDAISGQVPNAYRRAVIRIGGTDAKSRGSGVKTALLAITLAWLYSGEDVELALLEGAGIIESDTDTICTLAGALLGVLASSEPVHPIMDRQYIFSETKRLAEVGATNPSASFIYPDLLTWKSPKSAIDNVGTIGDATALAGLGRITLVEPIFVSKAKDGAVWQWGTLDFGQQVLCKHRKILPVLPTESGPADERYRTRISNQEREISRMPDSIRQGAIDLSMAPKRHQSAIDLPRRQHQSIDEMTSEAIRSGFDPKIIGQHLLDISERDSEIELGIAYAAVIIKARKARLKSG